MQRLLPTDPLFSQQWFLHNTGQPILGKAQPAGGPFNDVNVTPVWPDYTGAGVLVAAVDDGFEKTHPDLAANYRPDLAYDFGEEKPGAAPDLPGDSHGTAVMGLMVAARNDIGGVGVAYGTTAVGYRVAVGYRTDGTRTAPLVSQFTQATAKMLVDGVGVVNNSYGSVDATKPFDTASDQRDWQAAFKQLATEGRGGLGTVTVFAAGNERTTPNDAQPATFLTSYDAAKTSPWILNVAATDPTGAVTDFSTPGPNILVSAPGTKIVTTDRQGSLGYNTRKNGDYTDTSVGAFGGTSASAPIVSGVVALVLQANTNLGYRDVQEILAYSARTPASVTSTAVSFSTDWNGGAHGYSPDAGFGNVDALAAVRLAETWDKRSTAANLVMTTLPGMGGSVPAGGTNILKTSPSFKPKLRVQHVLVTVDLDAPNLSKVALSLMSSNLKPAEQQFWRTISLLMDRPKLLNPMTHLSYTFDTVAEWGSTVSPIPNYMLQVTNSAASGPVTVNSFSVQLLGDLVTQDHTYVYTNEFAALAATDPSREKLDDAAPGNHTVNAAAVMGNSVIDLRPGGTGSLGGTYFETADGMTVKTAYTGDGNDRVYGNSMDNVLGAGRGINAIDGGSGQDTAVLIGDRAGYQLGLGAAGITVNSNDGVTQDTLTSVEALRFGDAAVDLTDALAGRITAGQGASGFGHAYAGPVQGLQWEFAAITPQSLVIGASIPNAYLRSGDGNDALQAVAGSNVLDGGSGSNWLVGATGADGGRDTFFVSGMLDPRASSSWDTVLNFHAGDMLTVWGFDATRDSYSWQDGLGAAGYTGATLTVTGGGRAGASLVTLAGLSTSTDNVVATTSSVGGLSYLALTRMA